MKKTLLLKSVLLLFALIVGSGTMWADETYSLTPNQSSTGSSATTYITTLTEFTYNGVSWKMNQWNPKNLQVKTNQSSAASEFRFYNTSAFPGKIKQVVITFSALTVNDASKLMFLGGTKEVSATTGGTAGTWNGTAKTLTWTPGASDSFTFFAFYQNGKAAGGTNYLASSDAIVVTYEGGGSTTYTVTYDGNGATGGSVPTDENEYEENDEVTVLGNTGSLVKAGYTFGSWNTQADGEGTNYSAGNTFNITANTTLYAKWNAKTITGLSYTGTPTKTTYNSGESFDPTGLTVTATFDDSSEENVTASVTWTPNPLTTGTTSVTGTYMGQEIIVNGLTVTAAPGSAENPYTVAQAKAAIDASGTIYNVYVHGVIAQIDGYSSNTITYWISDDGTTTDMFEVYRGKGLDNADFAAVTDLELGDVVTVYGNITLYKSTTYEFSSGNYITSLVRKTASDLAITSSNPVALEKTSAEIHPTSTITWTTSSTGAMSFVTSDESVATVSNLGVITAVGEGSATITVSQAADETYKAGSQTVTVNVEDHRSPAATNIDLRSDQKILTVGDIDDFVATCTVDPGFTGSIGYSYASSDKTIVDVDGITFSAEAPGTATITVTTTPTSGNAENYKAASQEVAVKVNGVNSISLDPTSKTVAFSDEKFTITATVPTANYDGEVTAVSSNTSVATVSVEGTTVTVTPVAVGTATITVTAGTGTYYPTTASAECAVEFTAPEGGTTAPSGISTTTFNDKDLNYDEGVDWNASEDANSFEKSGSARGVQFGAGIGEFTLSTSAYTGTITQVSMVLSTNGTGNTVAVSVGGTDFTTTYGDIDATETLELTSGMSKETVEFTGEGSGDVVISFNDKNKSVYIKSITVSSPAVAKVTLNASGYATYCSQYPLDFTGATGYSAWQITSVGESTITFEKVTGSVKGGTGLLLKGEAGAELTLTYADSENTLASNKLVGTLAPTNISADQYLGLSGNTFVPVNAGNVPAGKALLPVAALPVPKAPMLTFIFEDETTGIKAIDNEKLTMDNYYDLSGRKVAQPTKGLYIVNGKKVVIK